MKGRLRFIAAVLALAVAGSATPAEATPNCPGIISGGGHYCGFTGQTCGGGAGCLYDCWTWSDGKYHQHCYVWAEE